MRGSAGGAEAYLGGSGCHEVQLSRKVHCRSIFGGCYGLQIWDRGSSLGPKTALGWGRSAPGRAAQCLVTG